MDKNSHQRPIVIGPTHTPTHAHLQVWRESFTLSLAGCASSSLILAAREMRKCNVAVQNNNGNCVPTVRKSMCCRSLSLTLFGSPAPQEMGSLNRITRSRAERAAWLLALLSSSIEHTPQWANNYNRYKGANGTKPMEQWATKRKREGAMCEWERDGGAALSQVGNAVSVLLALPLAYLGNGARVARSLRSSEEKRDLAAVVSASLERHTNQSQKSSRAEQKQSKSKSKKQKHKQKQDSHWHRDKNQRYLNQISV